MADMQELIDRLDALEALVTGSARLGGRALLPRSEALEQLSAIRTTLSSMRGGGANAAAPRGDLRAEADAYARERLEEMHAALSGALREVEAGIDHLDRTADGQ